MPTGTAAPPGRLPAGLTRLDRLPHGEVTRIGSSRPIRVNVRIVAATNEHLPAKVERNEFRADLLDRLSFEVVTMPPLRECREDIPLIAGHILQRLAAQNGVPAPRLSEAALADLMAYDFPGNVRELENIMERALALSPQAAELGREELALHRISPDEEPGEPEAGSPARVPVLFGAGGSLGPLVEEITGGLRLTLDVFGSVFHMLTRYEEVISRARDEHDRFPLQAAIAHQHFQRRRRGAAG